MKKQLYMFILAGIAFWGCEKKQTNPLAQNNAPQTVIENTASMASRTRAEVVTDFFASRTYKRIAKQIDNIGFIDEIDYQVVYNNDNPNEPIYSFKVVKDGILKARVNVVVVPDSLGYNIPNPLNKTVLPYDDRYVVALLEFNLSSDNKNGQIKFYDCNYGYLTGVMTFVKEKVVSNEVLEKPSAIKEFFAEKIFKINEINPEIDPPLGYILCDENGDGNIGFGECYRCFSNACGGNTTCDRYCLAIAYMTPYNCGVSFGMACAFIAMAY